MIKIVATLCCLAAVTHGYAVGGGGPTNPLMGTMCDHEGMKAADDNNMCWYYECIHNTHGLEWIPRRCAWMSKVSPNFVMGMFNPCTVNLMDGMYLMDANPCRRKTEVMVGPPPCASSTVCHNGGTPVYEANICWCICPDTWQGNFDCSLPTMMPKNLPPLSNICVGGQPEANWCEMAGGCLNGGTCYNQCEDFWCDCGEVSALSVDHVGKQCEVSSEKKTVY